MKFVSLMLSHEAAIRDFVADFDAAGEDSIPAFFAKPGWSHAYTVEIFTAWSRGERTDGWVPSTTRFLEADGELLGVFNFRHRLTEGLEKFGGHIGYSVRPSSRTRGQGHRILAEAKGFALSLGIPRVLLTCSPENLASRRIIECGGGELEDINLVEGHGEVCRYSIEISRG